MPSYKLSTSEVIEVAADILGCSTNSIRVRARYAAKGAELKEDEGKVYFALSVYNPYNSLEKTDTGYNIKPYYTYSRFYMRGRKLSIIDNSSFFFSECQSVAEDFVYLEFSRI